jgi:hypothetical protein
MHWRLGKGCDKIKVRLVAAEPTSPDAAEPTSPDAAKPQGAARPLARGQSRLMKKDGE